MQSYYDVYMPVSFLGCVSSDYLIFSFVLALSTSLGIVCTGRGSYGSDVGVFSSCTTSSIPVTKSSSFKSRNIFMVSARSAFFYSSHLMSLMMMTLLAYGLYNLYMSLVWL